MVNFIHFHNHTEYSILDGMAKIKDVANRLEELKIPAHAITDHGTLAGIPEFYWTLNKKNIVPILGCEIYVDERLDTRFPSHLTMLVSSERGYRQLIEINNLAATQFYDRPRITYQQLLEMPLDGLIALSGCMSSLGSKYIAQGQIEQAHGLWNALRGKLDRFFIELQIHELVKGEEDFYEKEQEHFYRMLEQSKITGIDPIFTNDCHYSIQQSEQIHRELIRLGKESSGKDYRGLEFSGTGFYIKSTDEIKAVLPLPIAGKLIKYTEELAKYIGTVKIPELDKSSWHIPFVAEDPMGVLRSKIILKQRMANKPKEYVERLIKELSVIQEANFASNYLLTLDYIEWAKSNGIKIGPGRGSMVGSLVAYAIGITEVDPVKHDLMFERAINPARPSIPDFDIDFQSSRRKELFDYIQNKYGDNALHIGTANRYTLKGALKQVLRVLNVSFTEANDLMKMLDAELTWESIDDLFQHKLMRDYVASWPDLQVMTSQLYENMFASGSHAAGVVISDSRRPLRKEIPITRVKDEGFASSFDMEVLKKMGFVKFDILGLSALDIVDNACRFAGIEIDYDKLDLEDPRVYETINQGYYKKLFQIEGAASIQVLKAMGGFQTFEDIVAMNALGRPGAIQFLSRFCQWRDNPQNIEWYDDTLKPFLSKTHGVILYQEQVMQIAQYLAGFNDHRVDDVKEAIKFFRKEVFDEMEPEFIAGCEKNGVKNADKIWEMIKDFSGYGFNRAHAVAYSILGYTTAWLKTYYPTEFYAAALSTVAQEDYADIVAEARTLGVNFLPPDVRYSESSFSVVEGSVLFGISSVAYCSENTAEAIIENRPYSSFKDFEERVPKRKCNSRSRENLRQVGFFRCFDDVETAPLKIRRAFQKDKIGVAVEYSKEEAEALAANDPENGIIVGIVSSEKRIITKKGDPMGFLRMAGNVPDITLFPQIWLSYKEKRVVSGDIIRAGGELDKQRGSFVANYLEVWRDDA